ncbi:MAG TPA: Flp pilus assembly protein CpaB [Tepidisphaeraceae bacterium]|jgi:pilus assembly protein CpaB
MKGKTSIMLLIAVALGLVTAKVGWDIVQKKNQAKDTMKMTKIVVAKRDLDAGTQIEPGDVTTTMWPAETAPKNAFTEVKDAIGRTIVGMVVANQPLLDGLMAPTDSPGGLQALVPEGMRAVTVEVNESSGVAGLLVQGARVDVISTLRAGERTVSKTIVENVRVTAVGHKMVRDPRDDSAQAVRTVTLVMSPKNAEAIELASNSGRPRLVLRGAADNTPTASQGVSLDELVGGGNHTTAIDTLGGPPAQQPVATAADDAFGAAPKASVEFQNSTLRRPVQIIRGGAESVIYYEMKNPSAPSSSSGAVNDTSPAAQ